LVLLSSCSTYKPSIPPSDTHLSAEKVTPLEEKERILPPVTTTSTFVPPPKPRARPTTYSVVVNEVPVKELLLALARDTKENIDIHPGLRGLVSLNAIDETLPAILERISKQVNMRYRVEGRTIVVTPDTPYLKTYRVNYVNMTRDTTSTISVSGQIGGGGQGNAQSGGTSQTQVKSDSKNDFWEVLRQNIESILASTRALEQTAEEIQMRREQERAKRDERLAQAEAVAKAGQSASTLFKDVFGADSLLGVTEIKKDIVINAIAGTVTVVATERQHSLIQQYLDVVQAASQRQVLIEATIAEVQLSKDYQAGVDWSSLSIDGTGFNIQQEVTGGALGTAPRMVIGYVNPVSSLGNLNVSVKLLEQFGNARVLSSPKLMALNNQTALLKVVDNVVYFSVQSSQTTTGATGSNVITAVTTTANTVSVGVVVSLTPQIHDTGNVTLSVRPTISRITGFKLDPNPILRVGANPVENQVPEITVQEMESVLQLTSGQVAILGGLMQDSVDRKRDQVPYAGSLPRAGDLFAYRDEEARKREIVIFIRPIVVNNPSLDSDELKHLRRLLPELDKTGQNP
jgi:general secretion pathway protein D